MTTPLLHVLLPRCFRSANLCVCVCAALCGIHFLSFYKHWAIVGYLDFGEFYGRRDAYPRRTRRRTATTISSYGKRPQAGDRRAVPVKRNSERLRFARRS